MAGRNGRHDQRWNVSEIVGREGTVDVATVRQLKEYHDSLLAVQKVLLSFKLVADTGDPAAKRERTSQMCEYLLSGVHFPLNGGAMTQAPTRRAKARSDGETKATPLSAS